VPGVYFRENAPTQFEDFNRCCLGIDLKWRLTLEDMCDGGDPHVVPVLWQDVGGLGIAATLQDQQ
jgi:hypothetical protein